MQTRRHFLQQATLATGAMLTSNSLMAEIQADAAAKKLNFIRAGLTKVSLEIIDTVPLHK